MQVADVRLRELGPHARLHLDNSSGTVSVVRSPVHRNALVTIRNRQAGEVLRSDDNAEVFLLGHLCIGHDLQVGDDLIALLLNHDLRLVVHLQRLTAHGRHDRTNLQLRDNGRTVVTTVREEGVCVKRVDNITKSNLAGDGLTTPVKGHVEVLELVHLGGFVLSSVQLDSDRTHQQGLLVHGIHELLIVPRILDRNADDSSVVCHVAGLLTDERAGAVLATLLHEVRVVRAFDPRLHTEDLGVGERGLSADTEATNHLVTVTLGAGKVEGEDVFDTLRADTDTRICKANLALRGEAAGLGELDADGLVTAAFGVSVDAVGGELPHDASVLVGVQAVGHHVHQEGLGFRCETHLLALAYGAAVICSGVLELHS